MPDSMARARATRSSKTTAPVKPRGDSLAMHRRVPVTSEAMSHLSDADPATRTLMLQQLQESSGNTAVTAMLEPQRIAQGTPHGGNLAAVQRDDAPTAVAAPITTAAPSGEWGAQRAELEGIRGRATARQFKTEAVVGLAADVLGKTKEHMQAASDVYGRAYDAYAEVVRAGREAAKSEEEWIEIGVGILFAVGIATGVGAAAEALEVGTGLAIEAGKELIVSVAAEGAKGGVKKTGLLEVVGSKLEPGGLKPEVMKLGLWDRLIQLHSATLKTVNQAENQSLVASGAEYAIGEVKAQMGGGAGADMSTSQLHDLIGALANADAANPKLDESLGKALDQLQDLKSKIENAPDPYGRSWEMERDIWILWMAGLPEEEAKVLDIDAIEDHLESMKIKTSGYAGGGYLGVDTGLWTTKADCIKLIDAAKEKANELKAKYGDVLE